LYYNGISGLQGGKSGVPEVFKKGETARFRQIWRIIDSVYWLSSPNFVKKKNWSIIGTILTLQIQ
jgi:hypothetical protein